MNPNEATAAVYNTVLHGAPSQQVCVCRCKHWTSSSVVRLVLWCVNGKGYFFGLLWPEIGGNEWTVWEWVSLWYGDLSRLFCPFGTWFLGQDVRCRFVDGHGGWGCCGGGCGCGGSRIFFFRHGLGDMVGERVVIEIVVGALMLVWWRWSVMWEWVWELVVWEIEKRVWWGV